MKAKRPLNNRCIHPSLPYPPTTWTLANPPPPTTSGSPTTGTCSNLFSCDPTPLSVWTDRQTWLKNYLPVNYVHPCIRGQNLACELKILTPGQFDTRDTLLLYTEYPRVICFMVCSLPTPRMIKMGCTCQFCQNLCRPLSRRTIRILEKYQNEKLCMATVFSLSNLRLHYICVQKGHGQFFSLRISDFPRAACLCVELVSLSACVL